MDVLIFARLKVFAPLVWAVPTCGATFDNLVKLPIHIVQGQDLYRGFQASQLIIFK
jgi:hypothetical protein